MAFPFLLLLISGGHCQLLAVEGVGRFRLYGTTIDDAVGEAFDKTAKLLGLPYPGGPHIEALARQRKSETLRSAASDAGPRRCGFLLVGAEDGGAAAATAAGFGAIGRADLAASFQAAVVDVLIDRTRAAMDRFAREFEGGRTLVVAGGVAANRRHPRSRLRRSASEEGFAIKIPPPGLCTDNAAMVAWAGVERSQLGLFDELGVAPRARWPLQADPRRGSLAAGSS